jgi:hypothetical protein
MANHRGEADDLDEAKRQAARDATDPDGRRAAPDQAGDYESTVPDRLEEARPARPDPDAGKAPPAGPGARPAGS